MENLLLINPTKFVAFLTTSLSHPIVFRRKFLRNKKKTQNASKTFCIFKHPTPAHLRLWTYCLCSLVIISLRYSLCRNIIRLRKIFLQMHKHTKYNLPIQRFLADYFSFLCLFSFYYLQEILLIFPAPILFLLIPRDYFFLNLFHTLSQFFQRVVKHEKCFVSPLRNQLY